MADLTNFSHALIVALASYWVAYTVTTKAGPGNILYYFRRRASDLLGPENSPFDCPFCALPWVTALVLVTSGLVWPLYVFLAVVGSGNLMVGLTKED